MILIAGDVIFSHCYTPPELTHDAGSNLGGANWKGMKGFSIEWWNFWKQRFGKIKVHDQASQKTREIASKLEEMMARIEFGTGST